LNGELLAAPELRCRRNIPELMNVAKSLGSKVSGFKISGQKIPRQNKINGRAQKDS
jgi:hypothetical protein